VLNRAVGRRRIFEKAGDYAGFEKVLEDVYARLATRIVGYVLMPNHFHLVLWPREDGELSEFMRLVTVTHTNRWHAHRETAGTGPVYQGRFKSFPVEADEHAWTLLRYVDRNPLRAKLVKRAEDWRWGSLSRYARGEAPRWLLPVEKWPVERRGDWVSWVNRAQTDREVEAMRECIARGRPFGGERWVHRMTARMKLESAFVPRGRPRTSGEKPS
jgi:putative transposase